MIETAPDAPHGAISGATDRDPAADTTAAAADTTVAATDTTTVAAADTTVAAATDTTVAAADTTTVADTTTTSSAAAEKELRCQIARSLDVIGEKWSLLIIREAFRGRTRFTEFRTALGAPSDILTQRLGKLVDEGVLEKHAYREAGSRERSSYHLTEKGRGLSLVLGALVQWGDEYAPFAGGQASRVVDATDGSALSLQFVDPEGRPVADDQVAFHPGPAAREPW